MMMLHVTWKLVSSHWLSKTTLSLKRERYMGTIIECLEYQTKEFALNPIAARKVFCENCFHKWNFRKINLAGRHRID